MLNVISKVHKSYNSKLVDKGTFAVPATPSATAARYATFKLGVMLAFNLNEFAGYMPDNGGYQGSKDLPSRDVMNTKSVNCRAMAAYAKSIGAQYALITAGNETGFDLFSCKTNYNMQRIPLPTRTNGTQFYSPTQPFPYCPRAGVGDTNVLENFCREMRNVGIEPGIYFNATLNINLTDIHIGYTQQLQATRQEQVVDYDCRRIQEILRRFKIKIMWCDLVGPQVNNLFGRIYNAIKSIDPDCVMVGNGAGAYLGGDVQSTEEYVIYGGSVAYQTRLRNNLQIPQEIVLTPHGANSQWYEVDDQCPVQPPYVKNLFDPVSKVQTMVGNARQYGCPLLVNMFVNRDGTLFQPDKDFFAQVNFML